MTYVIGVDTGGTFTDAFLADETGRVMAAKTSSTPPDFACGFLTAIGDLAAALGVPAEQMLLVAEISAPANFPLPPQEIQLAFDGLEKELRERLAAQRLEFAEVSFVREIDMRYTMQMAEVATPVPDGELTEEIVAGLGRAFEDRYEQLYGPGSGFADAGLQVITYRLRAVGQLPIPPQLPAPPAGGGMPAARSTREVFLDVRRRWQPTRIYHYADLGAGHELSGPAVVEAPTTTVAIPEGCQARVDHLGNLVISYS